MIPTVAISNGAKRTTMSRLSGRHRRGERGQVLVLLALSVVALLAMTGLVIDGANAYAQQRRAQNAADAAANAGALRLAQNLPFSAAGLAPPNGDQEVFDAVLASATDNGIQAVDLVAYYTDLGGSLLTNAGVVTADPSLAARVGNADGTLAIPANAAGVDAGGTRHADAFFTGVVGISRWSASADATAVAGYLGEVSRSTVLPVTIPVNIYTCTNTGTVTYPVDGGGNRFPWPDNNPGTVMALPLCKDGPGNVGWLDWTPPGGGGSELVDSILVPDNPPIDIPSWIYSTQTGNTNNANVFDALNSYAGQIVLLPMFDDTCVDEPPSPTSPCTSGTGQGQNLWYHLPYFVGFEMADPVAASASYSVCNSYPGDMGLWNGAGCLIGRFVYFVGPEGSVSGAPQPGSRFEAVGVQLIK